MVARTSRSAAGRRAQQQDSDRRVPPAQQLRQCEQHHHGAPVEHRATVLRGGTLRGEPGDLLDDRATQHILGDTQSNESFGADAAAGQARAGADQVPHCA